MILKMIIDVFMKAPELLLQLIPVIDLIIPKEVFNIFSFIFNGIGYLLPVKALLPILITDISLDFLRIAFALIIRIKSFIPTMGA